MSQTRLRREARTPLGVYGAALLFWRRTRNDGRIDGGPLPR
jgi:hypothetical protein